MHRLKKIRLARTLWAGLFPLYIMEYLSIVPKMFEFIDINEYDETLYLMETKQIDGNFNSLADAFLLINKGIDLRLIMISDLSVGVDGVVSREEISTVEMLKGKRLGVSKHTYSHIFVNLVLAKHGISEESVYIKNIRGEFVPKALKEDIIDAGHSWGIHIDEAIKQGARLLITSLDYPGLLLDSLFVRLDAVDKYTSDWECFINAHEYALIWWMDNYIEGINAVSNRINIPSNEISGMLKGVSFINRIQAKELVMRDGVAPPNLYGASKIINNFFINQGIYKTPIDLDKVIWLL